MLDTSAACARIGVDIGGTFTDLLLVDDSSGEVTIVKTLTTPADPSNAVDAGVREALTSAGTPPSQVRNVVHGTTLVTNAIIERKGDPTALITTRGFRDAIEIRREHRYDMYDLAIDPPRDLVPRYLRFEVDERVLSDGTIARDLDAGEVERLVGAIASRGIKAIAVALLHAYRNPVHERRIGDIARRVAHRHCERTRPCDAARRHRPHRRSSADETRGTAGSARGIAVAR